MKLEKKNKQIIFTAFLFWAVILIFQFTDFDIKFQSLFYNFETKSWILSKDNYLADLIFYSGFKKIFIIFASTILLLCILSFFKRSTILEKYKKGLLIVCLSTILVPSLASLKSVTNVPCPVDIIEFGGDFIDVKILESYPKDYIQEKKQRCWPAGHATMGFSLMALYFLFKKPRNQKIALAFGITVGVLTGGYKILIGDHFLSHTLVTMILACLVILIIHKLIIKENFEKSTKI
ncbi:phosphoesterase [Aliarcobacter cryaerophilus]|uniref:Phosphoesterase n=1 Tax=Aliarcobacter cryaerophilus TaxID=28198 RepID=A0A2S9SLI6_9BACT|nr:phosphatase PAP2 family protein [Aliarcobacter cryaerophilus]PRM87422.1 phosphoesterase [Aliarcobacter cryaerophilus]